MLTTVYFDLETGGIDPIHPNIQLAAIAVGSDWQELGTFERKIQFDESEADPQALAMNHYDAEVWKREAQPIGKVVSDFALFLNDYKVISMVSKRT